MTFSKDAITIDNHLLSLPKSKLNPLLVGHCVACAQQSAIAAYVAAAHSENTRRAYRGDLADFLAWGGEVPATSESLTAYVADRAGQQSPQTISRRVVGISRAHTSLGFLDPSKSDLVRIVLRGVRRLHGRPQRQVEPLLKQDILQMLNSMVGFKGVRDRALVLTGFAAALRRSELVGLNVEDLTFSIEGLTLHLRRSKTDQTGEGRKIAVPFARSSACPVRAICGWLESSGIREGAIFRSVGKSGRLGERLSAQSVALVVKAYGAAIGFRASDLSGHSLRTGFVTSAIQSGAAAHKIQQQTGHKSFAMLSRYIRDGQLFVDNACGQVL